MKTANEQQMASTQKVKRLLQKFHAGEETYDATEDAYLVPCMMAHIGSTDSELRDRLIYGGFYKLILGGQLSHKTLIGLAEKSLSDQFLMKGIEQRESDAIFTRSFTTLLLALIIQKDNNSDFLPAPMVQQINDRMLEYLDAEKDVRGFVPGKGWAHSVAHAADVFEELAKSQKLGSDSHLKQLHALWGKALISDSVYFHEEEERLLVPIIELAKNRGAIKEIETLLSKLPERIAAQKEHLEEENYWFLFANCKLFLKSFYIKAADDPELNPLQASIKSSFPHY
ncbi:DUF2785 domain-containing protein [Planococcus sp. YIM B11945]|uniref:DUF2785 domain-containing protein n=1 Tax=Planococcus sp. YIM B11945 TaxID=3435410 RepID=UPI003D7EA347